MMTAPFASLLCYNCSIMLQNIKDFFLTELTDFWIIFQKSCFMYKKGPSRDDLGKNEPGSSIILNNC